jgi:hypothetical protein
MPHSSYKLLDNKLYYNAPWTALYIGNLEAFRYILFKFNINIQKKMHICDINIR